MGAQIRQKSENIEQREAKNYVEIWTPNKTSKKPESIDPGPQRLDFFPEWARAQGSLLVPTVRKGGGAKGGGVEVQKSTKYR